jgi:lactose/L-arabinose transport system ATP-binding protein
MRVEIARLHQEIGATMIYVTHDQVEAMTLADKIVVLRAGRVEQVGAPLDLYADPDNRFVAGFIGSPAMNFFDGVVEDGGIRVPGLGDAVVTSALALPGSGSGVTVGLRPNHLLIDPTGDSHAVDLTESLGGVSYVYLNAANGDRLVIEAREDQPMPGGGRVGVSFDAANAYLFDVATGARLR